jgi:hypothetical protein
MPRRKAVSPERAALALLGPVEDPKAVRRQLAALRERYEARLAQAPGPGRAERLKQLGDAKTLADRLATVISDPAFLRALTQAWQADPRFDPRPFMMAGPEAPEADHRGLRPDLALRGIIDALEQLTIAEPPSVRRVLASGKPARRVTDPAARARRALLYDLAFLLRKLRKPVSWDGGAKSRGPREEQEQRGQRGGALLARVARVLALGDQPRDLDPDMREARKQFEAQLARVAALAGGGFEPGER